MKVITEAALRSELRASTPESYTVPEGKILSPAAREYLQQCKIRIEDGRNKKRVNREEKDSEKPEIQATEVLPMPQVQVAKEAKPRFVDYDTGAYYYEKPEHMTHLFGNTLVPKDHKRIFFRGKLDSLETLFVLNQTILLEMGESQKLIDDLQDILVSLREMMRCDVMNEPFRRELIIGLNHAELREHSHNPMKFYKIKQMVLPDYTLGKAYALLNQLRAAVRETEVAATTAFHEGREYTREDIIEELNRMSSAMHIVMCKYLAEAYKE
nr:ATP-binding protein [uncultured Blautia sp.]